MEGKDALESQWKCKIATCSHARFARIAPDMLRFVPHGVHIAPTVHLLRDAVRNPVTCAKPMNGVTKHFMTRKTAIFPPLQDYEKWIELLMSNSTCKLDPQINFITTYFFF